MVNRVMYRLMPETTASHSYLNGLGVESLTVPQAKGRDGRLNIPQLGRLPLCGRGSTPSPQRRIG